MLVMSRKVGEDIFIGGHTVRVVDILSDKVRIGVEAPRSMPVDRSEVWRSKISTGKVRSWDHSVMLSLVAELLTRKFLASKMSIETIQYEVYDVCRKLTDRPPSQEEVAVIVQGVSDSFVPT